MLCAMVRLETQESRKWQDSFFAAVAEMPEGQDKASVRNFMRGMHLRSKNARFMVDLDMVEYGKPNHQPDWVMSEVAKLPTISDHFCDINILDLAAPAIGAPFIRELLASPATSSAAKAALSANPNFPADIKYTPEKEDAWTRVVAAAKHADLKTFKFDRGDEILLFGEEATPMAMQARSILCRRKDLPKHMAAGLEHGVSQHDFMYLAESDGHRELVREQIKTMRDISCYITDDWLRISPEMDKEMVTEFYDEVQTEDLQMKIGTWESTAAALAAHPNATGETLERAIDADDEIASQLEGYLNVDTKRPKRSEAALIKLMQLPNPLAEYDSIANLPTCSKESLRIAFEIAIHAEEDEEGTMPSPTRRKKKACLALASHPHFPWEDYSFGTMMESVEEKDWPVMSALICLSSNYPEVEDMHAGQYGMAAVFSPKTSHRKLEKLATLAPEMAPIAAMHPNGSLSLLDKPEVNTTILPNDTRNTIEEFVDKFSPLQLSGKAGAGKSAENTPKIEI